MTLIIELIELDYLGDMESIIFLIGFMITASYVLLYKFGQQKEEQDIHYYGRHNIPLKNKEDKVNTVTSGKE